MPSPGGVRFTERLWRCDTTRARLRARPAAPFLLIALLTVLVLGGGRDGLVASASAAVACVGDCFGNHVVSPDEQLLGVAIALGRAAAGACTAADPDGDGVTIDDLVDATRARLEGCIGAVTATPTPLPTPAVPMLVSGRCRRPGVSGLVPCDAGFHVDVLRCDDRPTCLEATSPRTLLGNGPIGAEGAFAVVIDLQVLGTDTMLVQAEAALQPATIYRTLDIGSLGSGGDVGHGAGVPEVMLEIDPSSEGAMRALDADPGPLGLDAFSNADIQRLITSTRATAGDYAGLTAEQAAQVGEQIASELLHPLLRSFVSGLGVFTYHVLSSGALAHRFTTLALTASPTASDGACASTSDILVAGAAVAFAPDIDGVRKSALIDGEGVVFNASAGMGVGQVCVGSRCLSDASCPAGANDCQVFSYIDNLAPLSQGGPGVPDGVRASVQTAEPCLLGGTAFAFGTNQPTIEAAIDSQAPTDGFALPPSSTIVFAQTTQPGASYFAGVGGFRLRQQLGTTVLSGAVAETNAGNIPFGAP